MNKQTKTNGAAFKIKQPHYSHIILLSLLILLCCASCKTMHKKHNNTKSLKGFKLEHIYVYDNGKDTLIKDYKFFQELVKMGIADTNETTDRFVVLDGSTQLNYFKLHEDGTGETTSSCLRNSSYNAIDESLKKVRKKKDHDCYINSFTISKDSIITFIEGEDNLPMSKKYIGKIYKDSLILHLTNPTPGLSPSIFSEGDSIRVYKLLKR